MPALIVVANRGPVSLSLSGAGELLVDQAAGGLAPSLARALAGSDALWLACAMTDADREANRRGATASLLPGVDVRLLEVPGEIQQQAYRVIANQSLWYWQHQLFDGARRPVFDAAWHGAWAGYRAFNELFADAIADVADEGAVVFVNDYHFCLLGAALARRRKDLRTVYFNHTPFAGAEELALLPSAVGLELLESLCAFGACGFHCQAWAANFRACCRALLLDAPEVFVAPLGVDARELVQAASSDKVRARQAELEEVCAGRALIVRSDRVEPSKNLLRGFLAFEELLALEPDLASRVLFFARTYLSRTDLADYRAYRDELESVVARINDRFAAPAPPVLLEINDDYAASLACYRAYDVLLVNPIRDGMNLVAKEGPLVNDNDGVLALSTRAGAFEELAPASLAVEPFDVSQTAAVLAHALSLSRSERKKTATTLRQLARAHPPAEWMADVLAHARRGARPGR